MVLGREMTVSRTLAHRCRGRQLSLVLWAEDVFASRRRMGQEFVMKLTLKIDT